jgi:glycosyltransferase involved in cell wall biosynthesis
MTVTALCMTHNRRLWLPLAIECFQRQTYPARMLILADGEDVTDIVPAEERIQLYVMPQRAATTGEKCNVASRLAESEVICMWDDDDWSEPGRIADQVSRLEQTGRAVTGYHSMKFTDGHNWWLFNGPVNSVAGTSLCYRREWWAGHPFRPLNVGYDHYFLYAAREAGQLVTVDDKGLMHASIHPRNSAARFLDEPCWQRIGGNALDPATTACRLSGGPVDSSRPYPVGAG